MPTATHPRIRAVLRLLLNSGDITPQGVRQIEKVLDAEEVPNATFEDLDAASRLLRDTPLEDGESEWSAPY